jgi:hypothetical protein
MLIAAIREDGEERHPHGQGQRAAECRKRVGGPEPALVAGPGVEGGDAGPDRHAQAQQDAQGGQPRGDRVRGPLPDRHAARQVEAPDRQQAAQPEGLLAGGQSERRDDQCSHSSRCQQGTDHESSTPAPMLAYARA